VTSRIDTLRASATARLFRASTLWLLRRAWELSVRLTWNSEATDRIGDVYSRWLLLWRNEGQ
jgi:hypothetical protein